MKKDTHTKVGSTTEKQGKSNSQKVQDINRRTVLKTTVATGVGGAAAMALSPVKASAANVAPLAGVKVLPKFEIKDYTKIPQRLHKYPASDRAKKIVHDSITIDTLFSALWPSQWSSPEAPEFHDEMDRCKAAGYSK